MSRVRIGGANEPPICKFAYKDFEYVAGDEKCKANKALQKCLMLQHRLSGNFN